MVTAAIFAAALLAVVYLFQRAQARAEAAWCEERRELLNRIQRPEMVPLTVPLNFSEPEREPDGWEEVGRVFEAEEAKA